MVTHRFGFDEVPEAYDLFDDPVASGALKVAVLRGDTGPGAGASAARSAARAARGDLVVDLRRVVDSRWWIHASWPGGRPPSMRGVAAPEGMPQTVRRGRTVPPGSR